GEICGKKISVYLNLSTIHDSQMKCIAPDLSPRLEVATIDFQLCFVTGLLDINGAGSGGANIQVTHVGDVESALAALRWIWDGGPTRNSKTRSIRNADFKPDIIRWYITRICDH